MMNEIVRRIPNVISIAFPILAFSLIFWTYAAKYEVFPLNNVFAVVLMWFSASIALPISRVYISH